MLSAKGEGRGGGGQRGEEEEEEQEAEERRGGGGKEAREEEGGAGGVLISCIIVLLRLLTFASLQCLDGARRVFHQPSGHRVHTARSVMRCSASHTKHKRHPSKNNL